MTPNIPIQYSIDVPSRAYAVGEAPLAVDLLKLIPTLLEYEQLYRLYIRLQVDNPYTGSFIRQSNGSMKPSIQLGGIYLEISSAREMIYDRLVKLKMTVEDLGIDPMSVVEIEDKVIREMKAQAASGEV
jgi:hypothetical protein